MRNRRARTAGLWAASVGGVLLAGTPALAFPYRVEAGEDLNELSARFQIASPMLAQVNGLRAQPTAGQTIEIPYQRFSSAAKAPPMEASPAELEVLARIIKGECPPDVPYIGKVAVAAVVLNRVRNRSFPNTIAGVAHQPYQFSSYNRNERQRLYYGPVPDWCFAAARAALEGMDPTDNCTYYFNPFLVKPSWARGMTFVLRIGDSRTTAHDFYRPPNQPTHGNGTNQTPVSGRGDPVVASTRPSATSSPRRTSAASSPSAGGRAPSGSGAAVASRPASSSPSSSSLFSSPAASQRGSSVPASSGQRGASVARTPAPWDPSQVTGLSSLFTSPSSSEGRSSLAGAGPSTNGPARLGMSDLLSRLDGSAEVGADGQLLPGAGWVDDPEAKMCRLEDSPMGAEHGDEDRNVVRKLLDKVRSLLGIGSED